MTHLHLVPNDPPERRHVVAIGRVKGEKRRTEEISRICAYCKQPLSDLDAARLERGARVSHGAHTKCLVEAGFPAPEGWDPDGEGA